MQKLVVKNKCNRNDVQELSLDEFKEKFKNEIRVALENYSGHEEYKSTLRPPFLNRNKDYESDFYFDLRTNFNFNTTSNWYIDRIK